MDDAGRFRGTVRPTGLRPRFTERFEELGIRLDPRVFDRGSDF
jgi:pilus assembly protein CpaF